MEAESASAVLQCFLDLDNFHELLASTSSTSHHVTFDCSTAQDDAIVIYDKYVSPTSSSRMRVINHNWSATKLCPHPQSVAEISRHSVLSVDRI